MKSDPQSEPDLTFPELGLEVVKDISPVGADGFLKLVRRRLRVRYPDGTQSAEFVYDEVDRRAIDAVVIATHYLEDDVCWVYLRSALRPPVYFRDPQRSPLEEPGTGALWELPAGLVEPGEQSPEGVREAARRELEEELGFAVDATELIPLGGSTLPCPGVIGERHFFFSVAVEPRKRGEPSLDGSALEHFGRVIAVRLALALDLCRNGTIEDAKTELGLRRLAEYLESERAQRALPQRAEVGEGPRADFTSLSPRPQAGLGPRAQRALPQSAEVGEGPRADSLRPGRGSAPDPLTTE